MATILIVDDNPVNRRLLTNLLENRGHTLVEAGDGTEALDIAKRIVPDIIVADLLMPVVDGYQLMRNLRQEPRTSQVPVVLFTAHYGGKRMALSSGAAWFLSNAQGAELPGVVERVLAGERQPRTSSELRGDSAEVTTS